jgi:tetratricopeptide (TPR) repeat protein
MTKIQKDVNNQPILSKIQIDSVIQLYSSGKIEEAIEAIELLNKDHPNVPLLFNIQGACYKSLGKLEAAVKMFEAAVGIKPDYSEAYFNLGVVQTGLNHYESAIDSYKKAIGIVKNYPNAYNNLGNALKELGRFDEAIESYEWAIAYKYNFFQAHNNLGIAQNENGQSKLAVISYENASKIKPDFLDAHFNLGIVSKELGNKEMSINSFSKVLKINPSHIEAHRNLSLMKQYLVNDPQIDDMELLISRKDLTNSSYIGLNFALAKVYEDIGDVDKQFKFLNKGNQLKKELLNYSIDKEKKRFSIFKKLFSSPPSPLGKKSYSSSSMRPIFIVGMPRSGTSLAEQIIASHHEVHGGGELKYLAEFTTPLLTKSIVDGSNIISQKDLLSIRNQYLNSITKLKTSKKIVSDKMPLNFQHIGFILSALPEAKIVHLKRDARAICWSNYKFLFATKGNGFSFNQNDLASYYSLYDNLMNFWYEQYPDKIYDINYEDLTTNQEVETQKLLEYCDLSWDENCLNFHNNKRAVKTVSSLQVRQKMYQGSSEDWKKYKKHLKPLIKGLESY